MEGRVAIIVDGTPYVLTAPAVFNDFIPSQRRLLLYLLCRFRYGLTRYIALFQRF
jgi:spore germination protein KA